MQKIKLSVAFSAMFLVVTTSANAGSLYVGGEASLGSVSGNDDAGSARVKVAEFRDWLGGSAHSEQRGASDPGRVFAGYEFGNGLGLEVGWMQYGLGGWTIRGKAGEDMGGNRYYMSKETNLKGLDASFILHAGLIPDAPQALAPAFLRLGVTRYEYQITQTTGGGLSDVTDTSAAFSSSGNTRQRTAKTDEGLGALLGLGYDFAAGPGAFRLSYSASLGMAGKSGFDRQAIGLGYLLKF